MTPVRSESRNVGDKIQIFDVLSGMNDPKLKYTGKIDRMTPKRVFVTSDQYCGVKKFNRITGHQIGFNFPLATEMVAPETSK